MSALDRAFAAVFIAIEAVVATPAHAQVTRRVPTETEFASEPGGTHLLRIPAGTSLSIGAAKGSWAPATVDGWIPAGSLRPDKRDGYDVSVVAGGTALRAKPNGGATIAAARTGALFDRVEARNGWVHVRRSGWIPKVAATTPNPPTPPAPETSKPAPPPAAQAASPQAKPNASTLSAGAAISAQSGGPPVATLEAPLAAEVVERRNGWAHVRIDAWVREVALGTPPSPTGITAADIRASPDKYVGQTVEWTIQMLGIQKADELRPELPEGQPYLLARGPLPESGFLYVALSNEDADALRKLEPLATIKIRATIRAGRSRFLPTPVLNLVRRIE